MKTAAAANLAAAAILVALAAAAGSPEQRAAAHTAHQAALAPVRFFSRCGAVLVAAGLAALAYQYWQ